MAINKYRATVTNLDDPDKEGKFKITCPELILNNDEELIYWVQPELQHGWFTVPYIGQQIIVEIDKQDEDETESGIQNFVMAMIIKWKGEVPFTDKEYENPYVIDDKFKTNYKNRRGYITKKGHCIIFDDTDNDESISITWKNKKSQESSILFDKTGSIIAEDVKGNTVALNSTNDTISVKHHTGPEVKLSAGKIDIDAATVKSDGTAKNTMNSSALTEVTGLNVTIAATAALNISGATIVLDAELVMLKPTAISAIIKSPAFIALFDSHIHKDLGNTAPFTGLPLVPLAPLLPTFTEPTVLV
jgi:hypothetical protein